MIKLIDLIKEAKQVGTLYHFTSYSKLVKIINSGFVLHPTLRLFYKR